MKSYPKKWGKLFERYLDEYLPERKDEICARADREYRKLLTQMPDVGGKENMMASNMETWFSIVAFYEASDHVIDGKAFETIYEWHIDPLRFLGKIIDANRSKWVYKLFGIIYDRYEKQLREHQAKGEWKDSWGIAVNPENHKEGYSFHLIGCPIAKHAKENGYEPTMCWRRCCMRGSSGHRQRSWADHTATTGMWATAFLFIPLGSLSNRFQDRPTWGGFLFYASPPLPDISASALPL